MRAKYRALICVGLVPLAIVVSSSQVSAAGLVAPTRIIDAADSAVTKVHYRGYRRYCCGPRYHRPRAYASYYRRPLAPHRYARYRRAVVPAYYYGYGRPVAPYAAAGYYGPRAYYAPPVVYYPPPVVYYPAPVVYGDYAVHYAPYRGGPIHAGYRNYYGW